MKKKAKRVTRKVESETEVGDNEYQYEIEAQHHNRGRIRELHSIQSRYL